MRIEVNDEVEKALDKIRREHYIYGKGHSNTVAFLVRYYEKHGALEKVIEQGLDKIPGIIDKQFRRVLRDFVANLFQPTE